MDRGFTKLEIILVGIILLFAIGFLSTKALNLIGGNRFTLEQRFNKLISLQNDKNYSEAYNFYSSSIKNKGSLEDYIKGAKENSNTGKQNVIINNIVINDNIGYIDRSSTICEDNNCDIKKEVRGYKKWVFENGNWYYSPPDPPCIRDKPYDKPPEFDRALSLVKQRVNSFLSSKGINEYDFSFFNCLDIKYSNLSDQEGLFTFDPKDSSLEKLQILVNNSYKENDDLLTAFLLSHEAYHAGNFLNMVNTGEEMSCIDNEVNAFSSQLLFVQTLNPQEHKSINQRFNEGYFQLNPPLKMMWDLWIIKENADRYCGANSDCYNKKITADIKNTVTSNPYYQKQCGQN